MNELKKIAQQLTARRKALGIEQKDMYMRIGMKQQQYQRIESGSDIKLSTLLRILDGLNLSLSILPKEQSNLTAISKPLTDDEDDLKFWFDDDNEYKEEL